MHSLRKKILVIQNLGHLQKKMLILQCLMSVPPNVQEFNLKGQTIIQDHVNNYTNSLSMNKMKFDMLLIAGPYQPRNIQYPYKGPKNHHCSFQSLWFESHSNWLEYSPSIDAICCLPSYLFGKQPTSHPELDAFTKTGFSNWKKVND